jgi:hypothetical protein
LRKDGFGSKQQNDERRDEPEWSFHDGPLFGTAAEECVIYPSLPHLCRSLS